MSTDLSVVTNSFLQQLADIADAITMPHFGAQDFVVETKPDNTEVTLADRNTEVALRSAVAEAFPSHQVLGEEFGTVGNEASGWRWIIDPIDGTSNFTRGVPIWATLIAAEHNGVLQAAMVSCPALQRRWWAHRGEGAFLNGKQIRVSNVSALSNAFISYSFGHWTDDSQLASLRVLLAQCARERCFGDFWQHMMVAEGSIDLAVEPIVSLWDLAAVQLVVEEAGGRFTNLAGEARADGGSAISSNGLLHGQVVEMFVPPKKQAHDDYGDGSR